MNKQRVQACGGLIEQLLNCSQAQNAVLLTENALAKNSKRLQFGSTVLAVQILCILFCPGLSLAGQVGTAGSEMLLAQGQVQQERRLALVIGNGDYTDVGKLKNPSNDATKITQALREVGFDVILLKNGGQQQMDAAIGEFSQKLRQSDVGLFYYAGHATQVEGENYLIPVDAKISGEENVRYASVALGKVLGSMKSSGNSMNLILLDACRNNPYPTSSRSSSRGLNLVAAAEGTLISFATGPNQVAADGNGQNSPYTTGILKYIQEAGLPVELMFKKVRQSVAEETEKNGKRQVTWEQGNLMGNFSFKPSNTFSTPTPSSSKPLPPISSSPKPIDPLAPEGVEPPATYSAASNSVLSPEVTAKHFFDYGQKKYAEMRSLESIDDFNKKQSDESIEKERIKIQECILAYNEAIKLQPEQSLYYYHRGRARLDIDDHNGAFSDYSKAIELKPNFADAFEQRAIIENMRGNYKDVLLDLSRSLAIKPNIANYHFRARVRTRMGDRKGAIEDYSQSIMMESSPSNYVQRGQAYRHAGDLRSAISDFSEAIKIAKPTDSNVYYAYQYRGEVYHNLGDMNSAILDYDKAIKLEGEHGESYYYRGLAYEALENKKDAAASFQNAIIVYSKIIKEDPLCSAEYYFDRGNIYEHIGDKQNAIADFKKVVERHEESFNSKSYKDAENRLKKIQL
jgi:tetratricopeptide (TPR) repeat protein